MYLDKRLVQQTRKVRWGMGVTILAGLAGAIGAIFQALGISHILSKVFLEQKNLADVLPWMGWLLLIILGRAAVVYISETSGANAAARIKTDLRERLYHHWMALGPAYTQSKDSGEMVSIALEGIDALDAYFSQYLPQIALAGLIPLAMLAYVFPLDPISGLVLLVTGPLIPVFMYLIGSNTERLTRRQFKALARMSGYFLDTLQGLRTLKELGRSKDQAGRIAAVSDDYRRTTLQVLRISFLSALGLEMLGTIGTALIAVQVGLRLLYGGIGFEQAFFLLMIAPDFYLPLRNLGTRFHAAAAGMTAAGKIYEILDQPVQVDPIVASWKTRKLGEIPVCTPPIRVEFREVSFNYPGRLDDALNGASFSAKTGELTALVGASGSGKSTVAQLLLGFIHAQSGQVLANGISLDEIPPAEWRRLVSWVPQKVQLFKGTIADNLRIAKNDASLEDLNRVLRKARLESWVNGLNAGIGTQVGERGTRLSGGQMQRLALARAFLRDAPLLVMDEPTSHLDPIEEELLEEAINDLCLGCTVLVIAHRLTTVFQAGQILLMDHGRVVESGTHADLLGRDGAYARLARSFEGGA